MILAESRDPAQGSIPRPWLEGRVLPIFSGRLFPVDTAVARVNARLQVPNPRPVRDAFIAATAIVRDMTVVTRDYQDFTSTGAPVLDPWAN